MGTGGTLLGMSRTFPLLFLSFLSLSAGAQTLHPAFTFTSETFAPVAQALPEPFRAAVLANPKAFLDDYKSLLGQPDDLLLLVDKKNELPADYEPEDL